MIFVKLIGWVLGLLLKWKGNPGPSPEATAAREAGGAEVVAKLETKANAQLQKAVAAGDDAARAVLTDDGLRKYEASDPNNRDAAH